LKRVNRINAGENQCELYVITNNKWVQDLLVEQFKGLKQVKHDKLFTTLTYERAQKLGEILKNMQKGEKIRKTEIRKILGITSRMEFIRVLNSLGGKEFLKKLSIKEEGYFYVKIGC